MTNPTVSVVIPTIGRASLRTAVESALAQSVPVLEVIVVADTAGPLDLPDDRRIRVLRTGPASGSSTARQRGVELSTGEVIALLDDDDLWHPFKLERQLAEVADIEGDHWVVTCKCAVREAGKRERIWPKYTIGEHQSVAEYLFRLGNLTMGGGMLQSSTLCFPRTLALELPLNFAPDSIHDEPGWLIALQNRLPDLTFRHVPDCFSIYNISDNSVSRRSTDVSEKYIEWGRENLREASTRVRGDYFLSSAVTAAASARSLASIRRAVTAGFAEGQPGLGAMAYAAAKFGTTAVRRAGRGGGA
ncbi:glycosyltransferase family 2 protein [Rhodococcoides kyotonense]|uniref:Glycosyl transferase family 2 n=1 Tax=Rhodococcoides kyotonense TaxID=398843 RepID=A0A239MCE9_9NOCA|nr:glycosyltransferase family A protein [Rhodococcus kyotonensis]SNT40687.1 Glycosyl transferase family 2 [Rhodococcus kyotonensis]